LAACLACCLCCDINPKLKKFVGQQIFSKSPYHLPLKKVAVFGEFTYLTSAPGCHNYSKLFWMLNKKFL
jgi:hypothetical protein